MKNVQLFKKELAKEISRIRKQFDGEYKAEFPKLMMTQRQIDNNTGSVNCGGEWKKVSYTQRIAETVSNDRGFNALIAYYGAKAHIEYNKPMDAWQIRINW